jgi:predicted hydrocarbon binding protein
VVASDSMSALRVPLADDQAGTLSIGGARYVLIRPETLAALQKTAEAALGPRAAECFLAGGRAGGGRASASLSGSREDKVRRLMETGGAIGWGDFSLERLTAEAMVVVVRRSPFAEAYGLSPAPVCHLIRGVLEALAAATLAGAPSVVETACAAMGDDACRFETRR